MKGHIDDNAREIIKQNLKSFEADFGECRIENEDYGKGYFVYFPADAENYMQYCYNVSYLDGWLYGCVQGFMRGEFKKNSKF